MPVSRHGLSDFIRQRRLWEKRVSEVRERSRGLAAAGGGATTNLQEVTSFGSNPGRLRMFSYVPAKVGRPALVVVMHGCTQTAAGYAGGAGWLALAEKHGFALLAPEQRSDNNAGTCFNWFLQADTRRGHGETLSIQQMIESLAKAHDIDRSRIFITGLSAGGAMANAMLATHPELFAAGAIIAGLPFGAARNVQEAFGAMNNPTPEGPKVLGDKVRAASRHTGPWPRVSVWQGDADHTVDPANGAEIVKQWTDVHGIDAAKVRVDEKESDRRMSWRDGSDAVAVEAHLIAGLGHGTPLATDQTNGERAGPFLLDVGISSTAHIAAFFGLAPAPRRPRAEKPAPASDPISRTIERALRAAGLS